MQVDDELLGKNQLAELFGVSRSTIDNYIFRGIFPGHIKYRASGKRGGQEKVYSKNQALKFKSEYDAKKHDMLRKKATVASAANVAASKERAKEKKSGVVKTEDFGSVSWYSKVSPGSLSSMARQFLGSPINFDNRMGL